MWHIKKKGNKYRFYSTTVDDYLTDFMTKEECLEWLEYQYYLRFREKVKREKASFPVGWFDMTRERMIK